MRRPSPRSGPPPAQPEQPSLFEPPAPSVGSAEPPAGVAVRAGVSESRPGLTGDPWLDAVTRAQDLETLGGLVRGCTRCPLRAGCRQVVFGEGHPRARLMLVGEGPGQVEDETGRPFVGPAGQLLDRMLAAIGLSREQVYIANVVKCRPPNNRVPTPEEAAACWPHLRRQMELVRPEVVLCLGATAARQLVDPRGSISSLRGQWYVRDGVRYRVTFHPAALLRDPSKKPLAWEDLQRVQEALGLRAPK